MSRAADVHTIVWCSCLRLFGVSLMAVEPLASFINRLRTATPGDFAAELDLQATSHKLGVAPDQLEAEFYRVRDYLLHYYDGVRAELSFENDDGQVIDCVPAELLPAAREAKAR